CRRIQHGKISLTSLLRQMCLGDMRTFYPWRSLTFVDNDTCSFLAKYDRVQNISTPAFMQHFIVSEFLSKTCNKLLLKLQSFGLGGSAGPKSPYFIVSPLQSMLQADIRCFRTVSFSFAYSLRFFLRLFLQSGLSSLK